ncbi:MAG: NADP-dependent malic enzyme [Flavobacteriales bacterium]|nr:NADP-dependent malic enzyme [Flavobacteriales bacterium]|tara:strand:- start:16861 stop:19137 length:2277 start_codon:yes stop_codon:yes gene_type:complete
MARKLSKKAALEYHSRGRAGKIEVIPTKEHASQRDLSLAYSPGVAEPCIQIGKNKNDVYKYTAKGNLVAVISNGTAVLGLGNIGPEASKPVMEGKGLLFKIFADIDVFDIEIDATDVDKFVDTVKAISPTFGGINLEDIKAPECFEIERRLKEDLNIPIMHDDQHGTAIISSAALINALEIVKKKIDKIKVVINGAGAASISCAKLYIALGVSKQNIIMLDSKGVISNKREDLTPEKKLFSTNRRVETLEDSMKNADVFLGLSKGGVVSKEMIMSMSKRPIVFALANPEPEISYKDAMESRDDIIMATGRSDHPNQVNNVLGFPYIFRGAMDVRATEINENMKLAAVKAIAKLAKETVVDEVNLAYDDNAISFGKDYIIPKPLDPRLITAVAPAVAKSAVRTGVAQLTIEDWKKYEQELDKRFGNDNKLIRQLTNRARRNPKRIVFAEAEHYKVLKAIEQAVDEGIVLSPVLLGRREKIKDLIEEFSIEIENAEIIDPKETKQVKKREEFGLHLWQKRRRKGLTKFEATKLMRERNYFGSMMVEIGEADALISGITRNYPNTIKPALEVIGKRDDVKKVLGMYIMNTRKGNLFLADTTVNANPTEDDIIEITELVSNAIKSLRIKPRIALLSYSNFGSSRTPESDKMAKAAARIKENNPNLIIDGEIQADFALNNEKIEHLFEFSELSEKPANTLIFPNLESGNIAYKLIQELEDTDSIGPILVGMKKPVHILQLGSTVREIVNMITLAVVDAQITNK